MSIQTAIENAQQKVENAYTAVQNKGGTMPATQNLSNLPTAINSISTGITPTGTISITENGQFDVTNYATADVNVSGGGGEGRYLVQVIDYDGTVLKSEKLDTGNTFILPSNPSHSGLVFQRWSSPVAIMNNTVTVTDSDITIGATYTTASGLSEFDITLTAVTGLSVTLNMDGTKNWGDGTSDTSTTHTYASEGNYTITCDGTTMTTSFSSGIMGQSSDTSNNNVRYILTSARMANVTSIGSYAFQRCSSLTSVTIPSGVAGMYGAFQGCTSLTSITIPSGVTSIGGAFQGCTSLTSITIPSGVTSIGGAFRYCYSLTSVTIPSGVAGIGNYTFDSCYSLTSVTIPSNIRIMGDFTFQYCYSLTSVTIPSGVIEMYGTFSSCGSLTSITIPSGVTSISRTEFYNCYSIIEYDFSNHTSVPTLSGTNAFYGINGICKIKVPASLETSWKAATNWSTYANYIVGV